MENIRYIGFKNFRKFKTLDRLELGDLTIMTGGNNSGKSTIVKAALLVINFLQKRKLSMKEKGLLGFAEESKFFFDLPNVHISSFSRAINNECSPEKDTITFEVGIERFDVLLKVKAASDSTAAYGNVAYISVDDVSENIGYHFDFNNREMSIIFKDDSNADNDVRTSKEFLQEERKRLKAKLKGETDFSIISQVNLRLADIEKQIKAAGTSSSMENKMLNFPLSTFVNSNEQYAITDLMKSLLLICNEDIEDKSTKEQKKYILTKEKSIQSSVFAMTSMLNDLKIEYLTAHAASQNAVFTAYNLNDYTAQTIHNYIKSGITKSSKAYKFVCDWMEKFEIGVDIKIDSLANEAYSVSIEDKNGIRMPLADKGMGSIQLMTLLLKLATFINEYQYVATLPTILLEEPEQNLHPKIQSRLAELFYDIINRGFDIITETHSEYLVRKMQVLAAMDMKEYHTELDMVNKFYKVYFFNKLEDEENELTGPTRMKFQENCRFDNNFGSGFFDESLRLNRDLNKLALG